MDKINRNIPCDQCGALMTMHFDNETEELRGACMCCGYTVDVRPVRDENGQIIRGLGGLPETKVLFSEGYGVVVVAEKDGPCHCFMLKESYADDLKTILHRILEHSEMIDLERTYVTLWDQQTKQLYCFCGQPPEGFAALSEH